MTLIQVPMQKTKKYQRYFKKNTNTSIAANTEEEIFSESGPFLFRELIINFDGDDSTGSIGSTIRVLCNGVETLYMPFDNLRAYFAGNNSSEAMCGIVKYLGISTTTKSAQFKIAFDTWIVSTLVVKIKNSDTSNSANVYAGLIYDVEV